MKCGWVGDKILLKKDKNYKSTKLQKGQLLEIIFIDIVGSVYHCKCLDSDKTIWLRRDEFDIIKED